MSVTNIGAASYFAQPLHKGEESQASKPRLDTAEAAEPKRRMSAEEEEKLRRNLAAMASEEYRDILKEDSAREAERRAAEGRNPAGVVADLSV